MKTYKYNRCKLSFSLGSRILIVLFTIISFIGCTDLSESTYTFINPDNYYNTEEELESALNSVYADFRTFAAGYKTLMTLELLTEHAMPAHSSKDGVKNFNSWQGVNQSTTYNIQIWDSGYELINRCNVVLGRGDKVNISGDKRNQIYGQARFSEHTLCLFYFVFMVDWLFRSLILRVWQVWKFHVKQ